MISSAIWREYGGFGFVLQWGLVSLCPQNSVLAVLPAKSAVTQMYQPKNLSWKSLRDERTRKNNPRGCNHACAR